MLDAHNIVEKKIVKVDPQPISSDVMVKTTPGETDGRRNYDEVKFEQSQTMVP